MTDLKAPTIISVSLAKAVRSSPWAAGMNVRNGVVFDDPQVMNRVEIILHPERFPEKDPGRAALRAVEDAVEQNDNSFDGIINNLPEPDPTLQACKCADEEAKQSVLAKLKEQQLHEPPHRPERPFIFCGPEERVRE